MRVLACALVTIGCGDNAVVDDIAPPVLTDTNPDPNIVEVQLVASPATHEYLPGKLADVWAFRDGAVPGSTGSIPGPMIEAKLGDRVIVHFTNELPEETTIHWHGLRVPNAADGTPLAQVPVPSGASFDYDFTLIDSGFYWFHPHVHGDVQVEAGLYAPIVVHDDAAIDVAADRVFVVDDVKLEANGHLSQRIDALDLMLGRQGNVVLVNGRQRPSIEVGAGSRERWRFVNSANGRYFNLELPDHVFTVIGVDGGLLVEPYETAKLLIAPGERYEVLVELAGTEGDELALRTLHYDRGHNIPDPGPIEILGLHFGARGVAPAPLPTTWGQVEPIAFDASTPRRRLVLKEDDSVPAMPIFTINDEAFPNITPVRGPVGQVEIWQIDNQAEMDHPFHLHGMSFQPLDAQGNPMSPLGWKDTVNVPQKTTLEFAVRFGAVGRWMYHCHVLEHAERGMMGELEVEP
ncbi:MAG: multicopper oxidase family protein [Gemmatimonadaceae bacterium]|nr:multicopper oxidase family protein [Gemmatimonadaceae bacterium]